MKNDLERFVYVFDLYSSLGLCNQTCKEDGIEFFFMKTALAVRLCGE